MIDTKALRQKILDLAIRGKLVPQDPDDEPASVLLERIRQQKQQMVKEGKLKPKDIKNDSVIFVGEDNLHYEKFADGSVKCIENEIPFDIPDSWTWARLVSLIEAFITGPFGSALHKSDYVADGIPLINPMNITDGKVIPIDKMQVSPETAERLSSFKVAPSDIVIARRGDMGRCAVVQPAQEGWLCGTGSFILRFPAVLCSEYFAVCLRSPYSVELMSGNSIGNTMLNLNQTILKSILIPVPPCTEQNRIINAIFDADALLAEIANQSESLVMCVAKTKAKILDLAIQGQLVPQDPNDEPASVLLERIRAEKEELIKQGKIKRDKKESVIFRGEDNSYYLNNGQTTVDINDDLPFDIPDSWRWVRLKDVFIINPRNKLDDDLDVSFIPMPLIDDGYSGKHATEVRHWKEVKNGFTHFAEGDVGVAKITPCFENRKSTVFENLTNGYGAGTTELHVLRPFGNNIFVRYLLAYIKSDYFVEKGKQTFTGDVGQQRISKAYVESAYFPLPPVKEQERIVQQIGIIFEFLNMITDALS